jgi:hypothetical protein
MAVVVIVRLAGERLVAKYGRTAWMMDWRSMIVGMRTREWWSFIIELVFELERGDHQVLSRSRALVGAL